MAAIRHLGFVACVFGPSREHLVVLYHCAKFGWSRRRSEIGPPIFAQLTVYL